MVVHTKIPSTQEVEIGGSQFEAKIGESWLQVSPGKN
jgi:hypothetical protein